MGSFLSFSANGSVYSFQVSMMHGGDYFLVPMCFRRQGNLSMRSGTFFSQGNPCGRL